MMLTAICNCKAHAYLLLGLILYLVVQGNCQRYTFRASASVVKKDYPVTFTCTDSSGIMDAVGWIYAGNPVRKFGVSANGTGPNCIPQQAEPFPPGFSFTCSPTDRNYTMTIDPVQCPRDTGNWTCEHFITLTRTAVPEFLTVEAPTSNVTVTFDPPTIQQGDDVNVSCSAISCPAITNFNLYVDGVKVNTPGVSGAPQDVSSGIKSSIQWTVKAGQSWRCEADGVNTTGRFPLEECGGCRSGSIAVIAIVAVLVLVTVILVILIIKNEFKQPTQIYAFFGVAALSILFALISAIVIGAVCLKDCPDHQSLIVGVIVVCVITVVIKLVLFVYIFLKHKNPSKTAKPSGNTKDKPPGGNETKADAVRL